MSQYKGNDTSFKPRYEVNGEEKTPTSVVSTSMEVNGQLVEGYQSTYENGTSKWTPNILTDDWATDSHAVDNSTFTGTIQEDGSWKWEPTSEANVKKLAKHHRGPNNERITTGQIENKFYDRNPKKIIQTGQPTVVEVDLPKKKSIGHVDVAMNKKILMDKPKVTNLKTDEVIKGKVKTQKDKLKQMRGL